MEKYNARIPPEVKIIASKIEGPTRQHDNPVLTEDAEYIINLINSGGIEGPTEQPISSTVPSVFRKIYSRWRNNLCMMAE